MEALTGATSGIKPELRGGARGLTLPDYDGDRSILLFWRLLQGIGSFVEFNLDYLYITRRVLNLVSLILSIETKCEFHAGSEKYTEL